MADDSVTMSGKQYDALVRRLDTLESSAAATRAEQLIRGQIVTFYDRPVEPTFTTPRVDSPTVLVHGLMAAWGVYDFRLIRQAFEAVALVKGEPSPRTTVKREWLKQAETICESRKIGKSWAEALEDAGLDVPTPEVLDAQALEIASSTARMLEDALHIAEVAPAAMRLSFVGDLVRDSLRGVLG